MLNIFLFELKYRFSRPATYIYFSLLMVVALLLIASGSTPASEKVFHNAPIVVAELQLLISLFGIMIASAVMGVPLYRDIEHKTGTFLFSYPITKNAYFMGRFWGSFVTLLFISMGTIVGVYLGTIIGSATGWTDAERYGANDILSYLHPWATVVLPNFWFSSTLFFAVIVFTRNIKSIYTGGIVFFICYLLANFLAQDIENRDLVQILDPFGLNSFSFQTRYLTPYEQNSFLLSVSGNLLINRLLWAGIGLVFFLAAYFRFSFKYFFQSTAKKSKEKKDKAPIVVDKGFSVTTDFSKKYQISSLLNLAKIEVKNIIKDGYFRAIMLGGLIFLVLDFWIGSTIYSVPNQPSTSFLMEYKGYDYLIFVFIILVFFTGESLHRDKASGYSAISDTFPVKNGVTIGSKFLGMAFVCLLLSIFPIVVGVIVQTLKGYFQYDFGVYLVDCLLISFPDYLQMVMLVFAIHLLVNNKFAGHAVSIGVWLVMIVLRSFADYDFNLFFFSYKPGYIWSDMNGLGHFGQPLLWYNLYWTAFGLFLILFFSVFYARGAEINLKTRLKKSKSRLLSASSITAYVLLIVSVLIGSYIFKNVVYTNTYLTQKEQEKRSAEYEKQLKHYEFIAQPKVTDINLKADIFPKERDAYFDAMVQMVNKTDEPIDSLHLSGQGFRYFHAIYNGDTLGYRAPLKVDKAKFKVFGAEDARPWYKIYKLPATLNPGDTIDLQLTAAYVNEGFVNNGYNREIVYNGTFIGGGLPSIGYSANNELSSDETRKKYDLPPKDYELPPHDDPYGRRTLLFNDDADLINFQATVSTDKDQIAVAPGYLQKEWTEDDRKYFHYVQDTQIGLFFNIVSADYAVFEDKAKLPDGSDVNIEIFHHAAHDANLERFSAAFKDGIEYFSAAYGNYQFRQMRLLEFPRYASFAQSFPNTVPYSENFGWVANFSDPNDFDYGYFVTAHELAHQWWGHQVSPNYTRGSNLISEALAEYTALVLTEKKYGKDNMQRFLKQELDNYLSGRSNENKKEHVFINCNRSYQWYYKGSLILYGLRDYVGDSVMNTALRKFRDKFALKTEPPYAGSNDLYTFIKAEVPDSIHYYLEDTWLKLTLYENKVEEAKARKIADNEFEVTIDITSQKLYADSLGMESDAQYAGDYIDIGVFAAEDTDENGRKRTNPLYLQKHKLAPGEHSITVKVKGEPVKAGIDPYNKLIDRIPDDNTTGVDIED